MRCTHCGKWSGFFQDYHEDCAKAAAAVNFRSANAPQFHSSVPRFPFWPLFWAIFVALWAFSLTAGLVFALVRALLPI